MPERTKNQTLRRNAQCRSGVRSQRCETPTGAVRRNPAEAIPLERHRAVVSSIPPTACRNRLLRRGCEGQSKPNPQQEQHRNGKNPTHEQTNCTTSQERVAARRGNHSKLNSSICESHPQLAGSAQSMSFFMGVSVLDLSAYFGITALGAATLNMLLGMLIAFRYSPVRCWPYRKFNYFRLHNWCGYLALSASILHPLLLLFNKSPKFTFADLVYPVHSPSQPFENTVGAVALYLISIVVITSYFRVRLGRRVWKAFHFVIYFAAAALFFHSLLTVPDLKNTPVDWFDGGKVFVELCLVLITAASLLRWRHSHRKANRADRALPKTAALE
jgi:sulfoxide reductase heme-binding subunit YedZ